MRSNRNPSKNAADGTFLNGQVTYLITPSTQPYGSILSETRIILAKSSSDTTDSLSIYMEDGWSVYQTPSLSLFFRLPVTTSNQLVEL